MRLIIRTDDVVNQEIVYKYHVFKSRKAFVRWLDERNGYMVSDRTGIFSHFRACHIISGTVKAKKC